MKNKYLSYILLSCMAFFSLNLSLQAQNVIITDDDSFSAHNSAILHVESLNKGLLIPRLTELQRNAIVTPAEGLLIYQTNNSPGIYIYQSGWKLLGSDLGTHTATQNLMLNNNWLSNDGDDEGIHMDNNGNVGIGISTPAANLHIAGDGRIRLDQGSSYAWDINAGAGGFSVEEVSPNAGTRLLIDNTGNVGIGTLNPVYSLDVDGEITSRSSNAFRLRGPNHSQILRIDGDSFWILQTDTDDLDGNFNDLRPFRIDGENGAVSIGNGSLYVEHIGNVGIGTNSPDRLLDVEGHDAIGNVLSVFRNTGTTTNAYSLVDIRQTHAANSISMLRFQNDADKWSIGIDGTDADKFKISNSFTATFSAPKLTIDVDGNVGIGTTTPSSKLEITGGDININDNALYVRATNENTFGMGFNIEGGPHLTIFSDHLIDFTESDNDVNIMRIDANAAKIGIGTTTPTAKLSVQATATTGDTLFAVKDQAGRNVFVVYPDAVQVIVPTDTKDGKTNKRGAFLVSGRGSNKSEANFMDMTKENYLIGHNVASSVTGTKNTILGYEAAYSLTTGHNNVIMGYEAGRQISSAQYNVYLGWYAGRANNSSANVMIGNGAGRYSTGGSNVYVGGTSAAANVSGQRNVIVGFGAGGQVNSGSDNVFIGYTAGLNESGSDKLYIHNSHSSTPLIWGDFNSRIMKVNGTLDAVGSFGVNSASPSYSFDLVSKTAASSSSITYAGRFYHQYNSNYARGVIIRAGSTSGSSSGTVYFIRCADYDGTYVGNIYSSNGSLQIAAKGPSKSRDITRKSTKKALEIINNLEVMDYKFDVNNDFFQTGFIAEDVMKVFPEMVNFDQQENEYSISHSALVPLLTKALQEQQAKMETKDQEIENLKTRLEAIEQFIQNQNK